MITLRHVRPVESSSRVRRVICLWGALTTTLPLAAMAATGLADPVEVKLSADDAAPYDTFATSVAINGSTALVGAPGRSGSAGTVFVFDRSGVDWTKQRKLWPSDIARGDGFGFSVAIDGNTAIVGAYEKTGPAGTRQGAAYIFTRTGEEWTQQAKLLASAPASNDYFGCAVAISGDAALVGAGQWGDPGNANAGTGPGAAYVFARDAGSWSLQTKLEAPTRAIGDSFGRWVGLSGNTAVVGAPDKTGSAGVKQGAAFVFVRSDKEWTLQAKLTASDAAQGDYFGAVAVGGDVAVVGACSKGGPAGGQQGTAYIFRRADNKWTQEAKVLAADGAAKDWFGRAVAIAGDTAIVGADRKAGADGPAQGAAYVFKRAAGSWAQAVRLVPSDGRAGDSFGHSVAVAGDSAVVGSTWKDGPAGRYQGAAYVFSALPDAPANAQSVSPATAQQPTAAGPLADLRLGFKPGDSFRYRYTRKEREYAPDKKSIESMLEGDATIEGKVKAAENEGRKLEMKYTHISFRSTVGKDELVFDSSSVPKGAAEKAVKHVMDQVMGKTITVVLNQRGKMVSGGGLPPGVFAGIAEYQREDEIRSAGKVAGPGLGFLESLGTGDMLEWDEPLVGVGEDPPERAAVGAKWQSGDEHLLELVEINADRAIIRANGEKGLPPAEDPLRAPTRFVWDTKTGTLVEWETSFDSADMPGTNSRSVHRQKLMREQLEHASP